MSNNESFNVLLEDWIPVFYDDGRVCEVSLNTVLKDAHKIKTLSDKQPYVKIAILRLLTAFISDVYQLENKKERKNLYDKGSFDENLINQYEQNCITKYGASFDLFDSKRPFMIFPYDETIDLESTRLPGTYLHLELPSGQNVVHIVAQRECDFKGDTPAQFLRAVLSRYLYPTANPMKGANEETGANCYIKSRENDQIIFKKSYGSMGVNAGNSLSSPVPEYFWPEGNNLFETLVMCMSSIKELGNLPLNDPPAPWNSATIPDAKSNKRGDIVSKVSFVSGLTFQSRRIVIASINENKLIKESYISNGYVNSDTQLWEDPFAARARNRKTQELYYLQGKKNRAMWRDVGNITASSDTNSHKKPRVLNSLSNEYQYEKICSVAMLLHEKKANYEGMLYDDTLKLPKTYLEDGFIGEYLKEKMEIVEESSKCWDRLKRSLLFKNTEEVLGHYADEAISKYWEEIHKFLFNETKENKNFLDFVLVNYENDCDGFSEKCDEYFFSKLKKIVYKICREQLQNINSWEMLVRVVKQIYGENGCLNEFNKILKKFRNKEG